MDIYIRTKKNVWLINKKGIRRVKQPDWERIESSLTMLLRYEEYQARRESGRSQVRLTFNEGGNWRKREDNRLPDTGYGKENKYLT